MRVFRRLPEKCIYIECPVGLEGGYGTIYGWFALLDYDYRSGAWELRIVEDNSAGHLFVAPFELTEGLDVRDSLATYATEGAKQFGAAPSGESISKARETLFEQVEPALKILMYLCSDEPEIANHDAQEGKHAAGIKRVKGRVRLFEQPKTRIWTIGEKTAAAIHAAESASTRQGRKSPHVRRAHWHGYWRGHRDGERQFGYKWLPPIIVNDDLIDTGGGEDTEE